MNCHLLRPCSLLVLIPIAFTKSHLLAVQLFVWLAIQVSLVISAQRQAGQVLASQPIPAPVSALRS
jgi:hypothetical protein